MAAQLRLQKEQLRDLALVRELDVSMLQDVIKRLRALEPVPLRPELLRKELQAAVPDKKDSADALMRQMLSLHSLIADVGITADDVFAGLANGLRASSGWTPEEIKKWKEHEPAIRELFSLEAVRVVAKVLDVSYEYSHLFRRARIITDIRPVYSVDCSSIEGAVVSHTLRLRYDTVASDESISLALDDSDIVALRSECDRAIAKSKTASKVLTDGTKVRVVVSGTRENARK